MKKKVYWLFIIFIIMFTSGCFFNKKNIEGTDEDYTYENTYYVITKNVDSGKISYFEVNNKGNRRKTEKFESDTFDEIIYLHNCFDIKDNIIMNSCKLTNDFGEVSLDGINQKIVYQISLLEHSMFDVKIYKKNNDYYVVRDINVNIYDPYELYKYDINDNKLELICKISDEEIIGFKKKSLENESNNDEIILLGDPPSNLDSSYLYWIKINKKEACKNDINLYMENNSSNIYYFCINELFVSFNPNLSSTPTLKMLSSWGNDINKIINDITSKMSVKEQFRDGGSIMYEKDNLRILKCNTVDGNKDIYIGYNNLEYNDGYCMNANLEKNKESKKTKNDNKSTYDELKAEFIGYANQFIIRSTYVFENNKAIACYMEIESDNELFLKPFPEDLSYLYDPLVKNVRYEGNKKYYEWSDEYFEEKGKGCSKAEIEDFLRELGYTIIN